MNVEFRSLLIASVCALAFHAQTGFAKMYGKLDIGVAMPLAFDATPTTPIDSAGYNGFKAGVSMTYGFGVGAYLTPSLRADVSILNFDRFKFSQTTSGFVQRPAVNLSTPPPPPDAVKGITTQNISSSVLQTAFYYDLGDYKGFVPYIGVAAGLAMHDPQTFTDNFPALSVLAVNNQVIATATGVGYDIFSGKKTTSLAFGVGLGVSYEINKSYSFDIGYMYQDLGRIYTENG